jgi:PadR family transcriptional regulator AphA
MALEHVLLGLIARSPANGYELKSKIDAELAPLWSAELAQIYPALDRLRRAGYAAARTIGPRRGPASRRHRITRAGRRELARWLDEPPIAPSLRDESAVRLLFIDALRPDRRSPAWADYERAIAESAARLRGRSGAAPFGEAARLMALARLDAARRFAKAAARAATSS